ncbi:MAG: hypothetical protein SPI71_03025 [Acidaminococcaceae bacterium]|nr:hypothetical protein [Acidaminococcaceae bacterium]
MKNKRCSSCLQENIPVQLLHPGLTDSKWHGIYGVYVLDGGKL